MTPRRKPGCLYDASGKLTDQFGRVVSEADATKKGLKAVSDEARFASEHADKAAEAWGNLGKGIDGCRRRHARRGRAGGEGLRGFRQADVFGRGGYA